MVEQGMVIFEDGTTLPFGNYVCPDEPQYRYSKVHETGFMEEIITSIPFRLSDHIYNDNLDLYHNSAILSFDGLIIILNKQQSTTSPTEILAFVPGKPTKEQYTALETNETLSKIEIQVVTEYQSYDFNDRIHYANLNEYLKKKKEMKESGFHY